MKTIANSESELLDQLNPAAAEVTQHIKNPVQDADGIIDLVLNEETGVWEVVYPPV